MEKLKEIGASICVLMVKVLLVIVLAKVLEYSLLPDWAEVVIVIASIATYIRISEKFEE